jgi:hypothetical protein
MARPDVRTLQRNQAWASKLSDYEEEIRGLRKKRKSYREIAAYLREEHGIEISYNGVFSFVRARKRHKLYVLPEKSPEISDARVKKVTAAAPLATTPARKKIIGSDGQEIKNAQYEPADPKNI